MLYSDKLVIGMRALANKALVAWFFVSISGEKEYTVTGSF